MTSGAILELLELGERGRRVGRAIALDRTIPLRSQLLDPCRGHPTMNRQGADSVMPRRRSRGVTQTGPCVIHPENYEGSLQVRVEHSSCANAWRMTDLMP